MHIVILPERMAPNEGILTPCFNLPHFSQTPMDAAWSDRLTKLTSLRHIISWLHVLIVLLLGYWPRKMSLGPVSHDEPFDITSTGRKGSAKRPSRGSSCALPKVYRDASCCHVDSRASAFRFSVRSVRIILASNAFGDGRIWHTTMVFRGVMPITHVRSLER